MSNFQFPPKRNSRGSSSVSSIFGCVGDSPQQDPSEGTWRRKRKNEQTHSRQGDISNFDVLVRPFVEELDGADFVGDFPRQHLVAAGVLNLDLAIVGHCCR